MEFDLKNGIWESLRHEEIPETHALTTLLTVNAWLFNGKKTSCISCINKLLQNIFCRCVSHRSDGNFTSDLCDTQFSKPEILK